MSKRKKLTPEQKKELDRLMVQINAQIDQADMAAKEQGEHLSKLRGIAAQLFAEAKTRAAALKNRDEFDAMWDQAVTVGGDIGFFAMVGLLTAAIDNLKAMPRIRRRK